MRFTLPIALAACLLLSPVTALADGPAAASPSAVTRARELLTRSNALDEAADADEKSSLDLEKRLPGLRVSAKTARERASKAFGNDHDRLASAAERLEADVIVSEAEISAKRRAVVDNRRSARELRVLAVSLVRGESEPEKATPSATASGEAGAGFLSLDAYPWCRVSLDGQVLGDTPIIHVQLPAGAHVLTLENPYENLRKTMEVTIKPGETLVKRLAY